VIDSPYTPALYAGATAIRVLADVTPLLPVMVVGSVVTVLALGVYVFGPHDAH
jgi:hypothetical protein